MFENCRPSPQIVGTSRPTSENAAARTLDEFRIGETASRLGILPQQIDDTLYDAFGQRQVGTMFTQLNQYYVILEIDPSFPAQVPESLSQIYVKSGNGT